MLASQVLQQTFHRFKPSRLGAIPLFLALLFFVRWTMGESPIPDRPIILIGGALYLAGFYAFSPWAWQWTGDERHRTGLIRGWIQALVWNLVWLSLLSLIHHFHRGPEPIHIARGMAFIAEQCKLPVEIVRLIVQMPFAILVGWFVAEKEASDLDSAESERARKLLEDQNREFRNQALLAELDPHVLYNAMGALSELVRENPAVAEEALLDLSDLYRELTRLREQAWIGLNQERDLIEKYLRIEVLRLESRLKIEWEWPADLQSVAIPPMLLLPLVENAVKHGIAPERSGGMIRIEGLRNGAGGIVLRVLNTGKLFNADTALGGTGLRNLRARLALLGKGTSSFSLRAEDGWTHAELSLNADAIRELR